MSDTAGRIKAELAMSARRRRRPTGSETATMAATAKMIRATRLTTDVITFAALVITIIVLAIGMIVAPFALTTWYTLDYSGDQSAKTEHELTENRGRVLESPTAHPSPSSRPSVDTPVAMATPGETTPAPSPSLSPTRRTSGVRGVQKTREGTLAPRVAGVERGNLGTQLGSRQEPVPTATQDRLRRLRSGHGRDNHGPGSRIRND